MSWNDVLKEFVITLNNLLKKLLSVRAIVTVVVVSTLCILVVKCLDLLTTTMENAEQFDRVKDVLMYILGAFTSVVTMATTAYFGRSDRWRLNKQEKEIKPENET